MVRRQWGVWVAICAVSAWLGLAGAASAQATGGAAPGAEAAVAVEAPPPDDARALFLRGQTAYSQGDYEDAATLWEQAYALEARVGLQYNLSQVYERLGRLEEAAGTLERYVAGTAPEDERLPDARARLAAIRERVARTAVRLQGGPEGGVLLVDGEDRGRLPRPDPLLLTPGSHDIRVRAPGYADFAASVAVPAGQVVDVGIEMQRVSGGGGEPSLGSILTMAGGGVVLATGLILGGVALSQAGSAPSRTSPEADGARTLALVSDILWPVGAAAIAGGLIWLIIDVTSGGASSTEQARLHVTPLLAPGLAALSASGTF